MNLVNPPDHAGLEPGREQAEQVVEPGGGAAAEPESVAVADGGVGGVREAVEGGTRPRSGLGALAVSTPRLRVEYLLPEHPREDRVHLFQVIFEIEQLLELGRRQRTGHVFVSF